MTDLTFAQRDDVVTLEQQLVCVQREIYIRRRVYKTRVATHRMTQQQADRELVAMQAVGQTLRDLIDRWPIDGD